MNKEEIISSGLLESYVLGTTSHEEMVQVEWWVKTYPEVKEEVKQIEEALFQYSMDNVVAPHAGVKDKIMAAILQAPVKEMPVAAIDTEVNMQPAPVKRMFSKWKILAAASVVLLIGSAVLNYVLFDKYKTAETAYNTTNEQLLAKSNTLEAIDKNLSVVQDKHSVPVALNGLEAAPDAAAKVFWMKNTGDLYVDPSNLPDAPEGMQYQVWGIVDGKPVDGGMIVTTKTGDTYNIQKMKNFGHAEAFAITLETKGGKPQPEGKMYVMGKML